MLQTQVTNPEVATFQSFSKGVYGCWWHQHASIPGRAATATNYKAIICWRAASKGPISLFHYDVLWHRTKLTETDWLAGEVMLRSQISGLAKASARNVKDTSA